MAVADEPDFGFLNDDGPLPESPGQFSFTEPTDNAAEQSPESSPEPVPTEETSAPSEIAAEERPSKPRKLKRPMKKAPAAISEVDPHETASEVPPLVSAKADNVGTKRQRTTSPKPKLNAAADGSAVAANPETETGKASQPKGNTANQKTVPKSQFLALAVFAGLVSIILLLQMLGWISLSGSHQLESIPDVAPLKDGEFQAVPEAAVLPPGHELKLGQAAQFGDVLFTPTKVVREPMTFVHMTSGQAADSMKSQEVLKLYFTIQNMSDRLAFAPWDVALMNHRTPEEGIDPTTKANSWLRVTAGNESERILNFFHSPDSNFNIVDMQSRIALQPDESRQTFIASSEGLDSWLKKSAELRWRLQLRKGVHLPSNRSVTTFIDVTFAEGDVQQL